MCYNDESFDDYILHCGQDTTEGYWVMSFDVFARSDIPEHMSFIEWYATRPIPSVWSSWGYIVQLPFFFWTKPFDAFMRSLYKLICEYC